MSNTPRTDAAIKVIQYNGHLINVVDRLNSPATGGFIARSPRGMMG